MKRYINILFLTLLVLRVAADEYTDPATQVIYSYDPLGSYAQVKAGERDDMDNGTTYYVPGSPNAQGEITILDRITVEGKEYVVNKIGHQAFSKCDITAVTIPSTVEIIDMEAFYGCIALTSVNMAKGMKEIGYCAFGGCASLSSVVLSEGLETIKFEAFYDCRSLISITIPSTVRFIEICAFWRAGLNSVISFVEEPFPIRQFCDFEQASPVLYVPAGTKEKYQSTEGWNEFSEIVEFSPTAYRPLLKDMQRPATSQIFDLQGRRLNGAPTKGMYIKDGKKHVVR